MQIAKKSKKKIKYQYVEENSLPRLFEAIK